MIGMSRKVNYTVHISSLKWPEQWRFCKLTTLFFFHLNPTKILGEVRWLAKNRLFCLHLNEVKTELPFKNRHWTGWILIKAVDGSKNLTLSDAWTTCILTRPQLYPPWGKLSPLVTVRQLREWWQMEIESKNGKKGGERGQSTKSGQLDETSIPRNNSIFQTLLLDEHGV